MQYIKTNIPLCAEVVWRSMGMHQGLHFLSFIYTVTWQIVMGHSWYLLSPLHNIPAEAPEGTAPMQKTESLNLVLDRFVLSYIS